MCLSEDIYIVGFGMDVRDLLVRSDFRHCISARRLCDDVIVLELFLRLGAFYCDGALRLFGTLGYIGDVRKGEIVKNRECERCRKY